MQIQGTKEIGSTKQSSTYREKTVCTSNSENQERGYLVHQNRFPNTADSSSQHTLSKLQ